MSRSVPALKSALLALVLVQCTFLAPVHADWEFIRGDANDDGLFNIADPVATLSFLFQMAPNNCVNSMDANDDDAVNIADPVYSLTALFAMGPSPLAPHPTCGQDPTPGALDCVGPLTTCNEILAFCNDNSSCPTGEFCQKADGDCAGQGSCAPIPGICPGIFDPVCGCDGVTYSNACEANAAGENTDTLGACPPVVCTDNAACGAGEFCQKAVGDCAGTGTCAVIPAICPGVILPVCGCDGNTYDNECFAHAAGVSVDTTGACVVVTTCNQPTQCAAGEFCMKPGGNCFGPGVCALPPTTCPLIFDPVCGCDGQTYNNDCEANMAGQNWDAVNTIAGVGCAGCADNSACAAGEWCNKSTTSAPGCGGIALNNCNGFGTCEPITAFCCMIFAPACGCDGVSYSNACAANAAGVNVAFDQQGGSLPCP